MSDDEQTLGQGSLAQGNGNGMTRPSGPVDPLQSGSSGTQIGRIVVDRELCIGATTCVAVSPDVFQMDDENKAVVVDQTGDSDDNIIEAARACPVAAIFIYDKEGKQMYP